MGKGVLELLDAPVQGIVKISEYFVWFSSDADEICLNLSKNKGFGQEVRNEGIKYHPERHPVVYMHYAVQVIFIRGRYEKYSHMIP